MKKSLISIIVLLIYSCENTEPSNIPLVNLPFKESEIKAYEDSYFDFEYEIIQLEFKESKSVVNSSILSKVVTHNDVFVIGEKCNNVPKVFNKNGKFINTILRGRAKNEVFSYRDFSINFQRNTIDIMDGINCIKRYDMNCNYIETIDCSIDALEIASFHEKIIMYDANIRSKDKYWFQFYDEKTKQSHGFVEKFGMTKNIV